MEQTITLGGQIEICTPDEVEHVTNKVMRAHLSQRQEPLVVTVTAAFVVDGTGAVSQEVYRTPEGQHCDIMRIDLSAEGATPAAPLTAGYLQMFADSSASLPALVRLPGDGKVTTAVAPAGITYNNASAIRLRGGQSLWIVGASLAANTAFSLRLQLHLKGGGSAERY